MNKIFLTMIIPIKIIMRIIIKNIVIPLSEHNINDNKNNNNNNSNQKIIEKNFKNYNNNEFTPNNNNSNQNN